MTEAAFQALADPHRRAILRLVRDQPRSVNEIAGQFAITQQAVSQHLKVLKEAGLVAVRPQGQRRLYVVRPEGLEGLRDFLAEFWPDSLQRLKDAIESAGGSAAGPAGGSAAESAGGSAAESADGSAAESADGS